MVFEVLISTWNPQLLVELNWNVSRLSCCWVGHPGTSSKCECPYGLVPGSHVDSPDLIIIVVGWNHVLIFASSFSDLSFVTTTTPSPCDPSYRSCCIHQFSPNQPTFVLTHILHLASHTRTRNLHRHKFYGDRRSCTVFSIYCVISLLALFWIKSVKWVMRREDF